ncbi:MAG: glucose-6-phosphate isomerase [Gemmatimonadaceae bacterium]
MSLRLDYSYMMAANVPDAISDDVWQSAHREFSGTLRAVEARRAKGELGFLDLALGKSDIDELRRFADGVGQAFSDVVVLGIGGSALGTVALRTALRPPMWNSLTDEERDYFPRLHVLENVDPRSFAALVDRLDLARSLFIVISKSGGTAETMAQYLCVRERLMSALGSAMTRHLVFITDPERGALRKISRSEGIVSLPVPANVGGRFSVLSAVGLLPAALIGADVDALLAGASDAAARWQEPLATNLPGAFATLQYISDTNLGLHNHVLMPYADALRDLSAWFVQLWAESLGKIRPDGTHVGPTPMAALGATDQHSQVQLFMEGPRDKTVTFVAVSDRDHVVTIPALHQDIPELAYLGGHTLGELLEAERQATASALARAGRPNMTLVLDHLDAWHMGATIMFFELATVFAGALYGVNPLDQPGVELGKRFTYALLGRPDAEEARKEWQAIPAPKRYVIGSRESGVGSH